MIHTQRDQTDNKVYGSAFEPVLLELVLSQMKNLYAGLTDTSLVKRNIVESFGMCRSTMRLLKEIRQQNADYQTPYILYTPDLMEQHESDLDVLSREYRCKLFQILDRSKKG